MLDQGSDASREREINYEFVDRTERLRSHEEDITEYKADESLGRELDATLLIKWTNQTYHDENLRAMFTDSWDPVAGISRTNAWRHRNRYYDGLVVQIGLDHDYLTANNAALVRDALQPTGVDVNNGLTAFACADSIILSKNGDPSSPAHTIRNPNFARLHSVEFNATGDRLLTASSSLDLIYEVSLDGTVTWEMDMWNTPFNTNVLGQSFRRRADTQEGVLVNPDPQSLKERPELADARCVLDDPSRYGNLGLPTNLTPVFVNSVSYGHGSQILATSFHRGEGWVIDRLNKRVEVIVKDTRNPHGLHPDSLLGGYMMSDTGNERVTFLTNDFKEELTVNFSNLKERKDGLERSRWLQYTTKIADDLYCAVIAPRQKITLFNPLMKTRRDIAFDKDWGIQMVVAH